VQLTVRVQNEDFSVAAEYDALRLRLPAHGGAIATFVGLVRDLHGPVSASALAARECEPVRALHLEHYPGMTERSIEAIAAKAKARWRLLDVLVIHRVGTLAPESQIVYVQVAASHRSAAFAACEFIMDYLKTEAVFWKREDTDSGSHWIEATGEDRHRVSGWQSGDSSAS
jgi:molybdopterin synthase catalytic subunit